MSDQTNKPSLRASLWLQGGLVVLFLLVWLAPPHNIFAGISKYQSVHLPFETLSIVISLLVFGVAWNAYSKERAGNIIVLACAFLAVALIDFAHMLSFAGMPVWVTPSDPEKAINFWLSARLIFAVALLAVALRPWTPLASPKTRYGLLLSAVGISVLIYWIGLFHQDILPRTFIAGQGLTLFKVAAEYFIVAILAGTAVMFWRQARCGKPAEAAGLFNAIIITILSELCFTLYSDVTDIFNLLGHIYKIVAYILLYRTVFVGSVQEPFRRVVEAENSLRHANRALKTLSAGNRTLVRTRDEASLLDNMCRSAVGNGGYLLAWVGYAQHDAEQSIKLMASYAIQSGYVDSLKLSWRDSGVGNGPAGNAIRQGKTQICQDTAADPLFAPWREQALKYGYRSCIAMPLHNNGTVFGVMALYAAAPNAFTADEVALLSEMGEDLSFGIVGLRMRDERDRALAEQQHYRDRLQNGLQDTVEAIAATVEMRDPYTAGHQRRVADLAAGIAGEMGLPHEKIYAIHLAGIAHDLGKISLPAEILSKPAKLSELEFSFIQTHPQAGSDILKDVDFPWPIAQMVLQHHERIDGSGYPLGLKGDDILLEARILAVADVIEAMASHRPYRAGLGMSAALEEIRSKRGLAFDAEVVDAALRLITEKNYQLKT
jgi:putative methionine-R-sulfoxide reductase with GAF domain